MEYDELQLMHMELATKIGPYSEIRNLTTRFNKLLRLEYGQKDYEKDRLDAHHIVERRHFRRFQKYFYDFGWNSESEMAAIAVPHINHVLSLQKLVKTNLQISSFSVYLWSQIKDKNPESFCELIDAYKEAYRDSAIWDRVEPFFQGIEEHFPRIGPGC